MYASFIDSDVVALRGSDVRRFCNGMFSNNARDLAVGDGQKTAMLDDRGRIVGLMDLYCRAEDDWVAVLEGMSADDFGDRYALYVVLDDVEIVPLDWVIGTMQGISEAPEAPGVIVGNRDRSGAGGFDLIGSADLVSAVMGAVEDTASTRLEYDRVAAGLPRFPVDFSAKQLPHEMGMREAFLHFEKGCYVGQETVNRIDVMGGVKRQVAAVVCDGPAVLGAELRAGGKLVGRLTSVLQHPELGVVALSVLRKPNDETGVVLDASWEGGSCAATVR